MNKNEYHIYGPPGTGKTTELVRNIERASDKRGFDSVLVCSHTKAAAAEITSREVHINAENVGTLHAICYRNFRKPEIAETHADEWNAKHPGWAIKGASRNTDDLGPRNDTSGGDGLLQEMSGLRNRMVPYDHWRMTIAGFSKAWEAWKNENGYIDFTDMIEYCVALPPPEGVEVVFIDEAQDFSALQFELVRKWLPKIDRAIFVGDDDQSIYGFSGADPENLISRDIPTENRRILKQSYRVPTNIHKVANQFIKRCSRRLEKEYLPRPGDPGEVAHSHDGDWRRPDAIADAVEADTQETKMILASCDYMLRPLLSELKNRGVAFHNPYRTANGAWNPLKSGSGSTVNRMMTFLNPEWTWADVHSWTGLINKAGIIKRGSGKFIEAQAGGHERHHPLTNSDYIEVFEADAIKVMLLRDLGWLFARATKPRRKSMELPMSIYKRGGEQLLAEKPSIIVGTIHSVKGGEADSVYLFPDISLLAGEQWIRKGPRQDSILRCFYVGMTRARNKLTFLQPADGAIFVE